MGIRTISQETQIHTMAWYKHMECRLRHKPRGASYSSTPEGRKPNEAIDRTQAKLVARQGLTAQIFANNSLRSVSVSHGLTSNTICDLETTTTMMMMIHTRVHVHVMIRQNPEERTRDPSSRATQQNRQNKRVRAEDVHDVTETLISYTINNKTTNK